MSLLLERKFMALNAYLRKKKKGLKLMTMASTLKNQKKDQQIKFKVQERK